MIIEKKVAGEGMHIRESVICKGTFSVKMRTAVLTIARPVKAFLKICSKPRNLRIPSLTVGWKRKPPL